MGKTQKQKHQRAKTVKEKLTTENQLTFPVLAERM
jgi:hypothetical protein